MDSNSENMGNKPEMHIQKFITGKPNWSGAPIHKRRSTWRYLETGIYNNKPSDPEYSKKYMAVRVPCPNCSKMILHGDLSKHKTTTCLY